MTRAGKGLIPVRWEDQSDAERNLALLSHIDVLFLLKKVVFRNESHRSTFSSGASLSVDSILSLYIYSASITSM